MNYEVNEIFYSLIGEGVWTGMPAVFIRLSGCNLSCSFCDTVHSDSSIMNVTDIIEQVLKHPTNHVVITGGEPTMQDLGLLASELIMRDYFIHLETNGSYFLGDSWRFHWVTISPKRLDMHPEAMKSAKEVKFLYGDFPDFDWKLVYRSVMKRYGDLYITNGTRRYFMPIADGLELNNELTKEVINFCKREGDVSLCLQMHKVLKIP